MFDRTLNTLRNMGGRSPSHISDMLLTFLYSDSSKEASMILVKILQNCMNKSGSNLSSYRNADWEHEQDLIKKKLKYLFFKSKSYDRMSFTLLIKSQENTRGRDQVQ